MEKKSWKEKIVEAAPAIVTGTLCAAVVAVYGAVVYSAIKQVKEAEKDNATRRQVLSDAIAAGKTVLPNSDGSFWIIDNNK